MYVVHALSSFPLLGRRQGEENGCRFQFIIPTLQTRCRRSACFQAGLQPRAGDDGHGERAVDKPAGGEGSPNDRASPSSSSSSRLRCAAAGSVRLSGVTTGRRRRAAGCRPFYCKRGKRRRLVAPTPGHSVPWSSWS